jgi:hypothetical protein
MEKGQSAETKTCPVCGSANLQTSNRQNVTLPSDNTKNVVTGILGYKCEMGHFSIAAALHLT